MAQKKLIQGQPKFNDTSQYNFDDTTADFNYDNSSGLPKNNDKFQNKDLYTTAYGSNLNNAIIERNLKFQGESFIRFDKLFIENVVSGNTKNNLVKCYMFSQKYALDNGTNIDNATYDEINNLLDNTTADTIFSYYPGDKDDDTDIGNLTFVENQNIFENLNTTPIEIEDFNNSISEYNPALMFPLKETDTDAIAEFKTRIFDENQPNPIYIVFYMRGDHDPWAGTDKRKRRFQVFRIDNLELFNYDNQGNAIGRINSIDSIYNYDREGGLGGDWGKKSAAWKVRDFEITINTLPASLNDWLHDGSSTDKDKYVQYFGLVTPPVNFDRNITNIDSFLKISPENQLNNFTEVGFDFNKTNLFPNYFPQTTIGVVDKDNQIQDVDLQSYYEDNLSLSIRASAPSTIGLRFNSINPSDETSLPINYFYFIIDWDDNEDKIKTLDDWLNYRPTSVNNLLELQNQNLYKIKTNIESLDNSIPTNTYITPGIKTIKTIMFSYDIETNQVGRWKLIKSRFYLDIPIGEYPDFVELGGSDYTTIPWPYTTPVIGGVDEDSKYKISIQDTLSSGKISDTDIIDEKLLINDLENNELGKSIKEMDLEQARFFNKSYDMGTLLGIQQVFSEYSDVVISSEDPIIPAQYGYERPIFIAFNQDNNRCHRTKEYNTDVDGNGENFDYICASGETANGIYTGFNSLTGFSITDEDGFQVNSAEQCCKSMWEGRYNQYSPPDGVDQYIWASELCGADGIIDVYGLYDGSDPYQNPYIPVGTDLSWRNNYIAYECKVIHQEVEGEVTVIHPYTDISDSLTEIDGYWDGDINKFSEESSVGQIFISDNQDKDLKESCKLELNTGELSGKSIYDSSGNSNKGLLIGDYKVKKDRKGEPMRRDSFIKVPKKTGNKDGAL